MKEKTNSGIRIYRHIAGIPQWELGEKIGRSQPWVHRAELGRRGARISTADAERIAEVLNVSIGKLFTETPE